MVRDQVRPQEFSNQCLGARGRCQESSRSMKGSPPDVNPPRLLGSEAFSQEYLDRGPPKMDSKASLIENRNESTKRLTLPWKHSGKERQDDYTCDTLLTLVELHNSDSRVLLLDPTQTTEF